MNVKEYTLPLNEPATGAHLYGLVHKQSFTVKYCGKNEIKLIYENNGEVYPFPFLLKVDYMIKDGVFGRFKLYCVRKFRPFDSF